MSTIYFNALAKQYFPDSEPKSASTQLRVWIRQNTLLQKALAATCYMPRQRILTPLQHQLILDHLGEPEYYGKRRKLEMLLRLKDK